MKSRFFARMSTGDKVFQVFVYVYLAVCFLLVAVPLLNVIASSVSSIRGVLSGQVTIWPIEFNLDAYGLVFQSKNIMTGYKNALIYTVLGTVLSLAVTVMTAYPLSRKDLWGRNAVTAYFTFTMLFGGGLIPSYLLINSLGLVNTLWVMILPMGISVWNTVIMRTYFTSNIPDELYEAASMDGCRDIPYLFRVVLPLSGPIIAVICLYVAVGAWNSYFHAMIYLQDKNKYPLQVFLRDILIISANTDLFDPAKGDNERTAAGLAEVTKYAVIIVASAPMLILYPFIQKYFVKGVMIGSIKG